MDTFFDPNTLEFLLTQITRLRYIRTHKLFGEIGLSKGQPPILFILWQKDGCTQREIAQWLKLKPATITATLKRMERDGLIERRSDEKDLRISRVFLTPRGRELRSKVQRVMETLEEECFGGLALEEKALLRRFFIQIRDNLLKKVDRRGWY